MALNYNNPHGPFEFFFTVEAKGQKPDIHQAIEDDILAFNNGQGRHIQGFDWQIVNDEEELSILLSYRNSNSYPIVKNTIIDILNIYDILELNISPNTPNYG